MEEYYYPPVSMKQVLRVKFTTNRPAPPALRIKVNPAEFVDVAPEKMREVVLERATHELSKTLEDMLARGEVPADNPLTLVLLYLMREREMIGIHYRLVEDLWAAMKEYLNLGHTEFRATPLRDFNADDARDWMVATTKVFFIDALTAGYKLYFDNRKASELYWGMVVFFDMACRMNLIAQNPCRDPSAILTHFSKNGDRIIWQNPAGMTW